MEEINRKRLTRLRRRRLREIARLPGWVEVIRGSLVRYRLTCGKSGCRCHRDPRYRHGPYWYITVSYEGGRQKRYLLTSEQVSEARRAIAAYRELWRLFCRISETNIAILKARGAGRRRGDG